LDPDNLGSLIHVGGIQVADRGAMSGIDLRKVAQQVLAAAAGSYESILDLNRWLLFTVWIKGAAAAAATPGKFDDITASGGSATWDPLKTTSLSRPLQTVASRTVYFCSGFRNTPARTCAVPHRIRDVGNIFIIRTMNL